ncbi:MAG: serine/threonine-protein kinase [Terrimicrobiaceae bacterium]|nr:serine/threonine-protein kinase [Terrimicrobiaceae bacterium]
MEQPDEAATTESQDARVLERCPACRTMMDVTEIVPFTEVNCPNCGEPTRVRVKVNHFVISGLLGEGGMGSVFRATDTKLNRQVALKILKKECSANAEEREKLAIEARLTASVNHPHVVKVFDFGQDHNEFYIAMELVEKGSLDHLMAIQRRVGEAQALEVGMQIAMGLNAALEKGLIHRDIKPGNILFADAHTTKLVDFGLAIVMDEEASVRGEIWGTPYYIAPEKLDNQPEDYRSDIYSLGGTLFHALAGRPPYEAESASMVALKQLKSQAVSLQAFAPDVSSETAYVINRMMAKHPDERYQSYDELVSHLGYAREKVLERTRKPYQPKQRVVMETEETRKFTALLSIGLLVVILLLGLGVFLMRDRIFPEQAAAASARLMSPEAADEQLTRAVQTAATGDFEGARREFDQLAGETNVPQPQKNWAIFNAALMSILLGEAEDAVTRLRGVTEVYSTDDKQLRLASFFVDVARTVAADEVISPTVRNLYDTPEDAFALLLFGFWNWEVKADIADGGEILTSFVRAKARPDWVELYEPLAKPYADDWRVIAPLERSLTAAKTPADRERVLPRIKEAEGKLTSGSKAAKYLEGLRNSATVKPGS